MRRHLQMVRYSYLLEYGRKTAASVSHCLGQSVSSGPLKDPDCCNRGCFTVEITGCRFDFHCSFVRSEGSFPEQRLIIEPRRGGKDQQVILMYGNFMA